MNEDYLRECADLERHEFQTAMLAHVKNLTAVCSVDCDYCMTYAEHLHDQNEVPFEGVTPVENVGYTDLF